MQRLCNVYLKVSGNSLMGNAGVAWVVVSERKYAEMGSRCYGSFKSLILRMQFLDFHT